jgi:uncharacterized protein (TIGR01777 family)
MRTVVAGGRGFLGRALVGSLRRKGHDVSVLTRRPGAPGEVGWSPRETSTAWTRLVREADAVVNLAGESIVGARWTANRKALLRSSRLEPTEALVREVLASPRPPVFVSGSAVGYYGSRGDEVLTETSTPGDDFLAVLCRDWEAAAAKAASATRVVVIRTGIVLARSGGALPQMARPFTFFVGGPLGSGRQYVPWIHLDDWVSMIEWAIATSAVGEPLNVTAPNPVTNAEMSRALGAALGRPAFLPAPAFPLRLALGEMSSALLEGQRVVPARAAALGFEFRYTTIDDALRAIYAA